MNPLDGQILTLIGYGSQGRAHALNLRDSGLCPRLGLRSGGKSWRQAEADGFAPMPIHEAVDGADLVALLAPDMAQPAIWAEHLDGRLKPGAMLLFAHGFSIHYGRIEPAAELDVALVAPKAPGALVRREYELGRGAPCLYAIHEDATGTARQRALGYAEGIGGARAGVLETSFRDETETDLFGEQAVLCGGATALVLAGWETLVEAGYSEELAYYECLHELKLIVDLLHEGGLARMHRFISETASYGDLTRGPRIIDAGTRERMRAVLAEIQSGQFAGEWIAEHERGRPEYRARLAADLEHPIERTGRKLRAQMPWLPQAEGEAAGEGRDAAEAAE